MTQQMQLETYTGRRVLPYTIPPHPVCRNVNLGPSLTLAAGTCLGQTTGSANDVQTLTVTGTPAGGTITVAGTHPLTGLAVSFQLAYNSDATAAQTAARAAFGTSNVNVTGGALPGTALVFTFANDLAAMPVPLMTISASALTGGTTPAASIAHTTTGRTKGTFVAYADGTNDMRAILPYDVRTDAQGNIYFGDQLTGESSIAVDVYFSGVFKTSDLVGLDANGLADVQGKLLEGTITDGLIYIP